MIQHKKNQESLGHMLQNGEAYPFLVVFGEKYVVCNADRSRERTGTR